MGKDSDLNNALAFIGALVLGKLIVDAFKRRCPRCNYPVDRTNASCPNCGQPLIWRND